MVLLVNVKLLFWVIPGQVVISWEKPPRVISAFSGGRSYGFVFLQFWGSDDSEHFWAHPLTKKRFWAWVHAFVYWLSVTFSFLGYLRMFTWILCMVLIQPILWGYKNATANNKFKKNPEVQSLLTWVFHKEDAPQPGLSCFQLKELSK